MRYLDLHISSLACTAQVRVEASFTETVNQTPSHTVSCVQCPGMLMTVVGLTLKIKENYLELLFQAGSAEVVSTRSADRLSQHP